MLYEVITLAVLDVAGAPAQVDRIVEEGDAVCIIGGGGKSGVLCVITSYSIHYTKLYECSAVLWTQLVK